MDLLFAELNKVNKVNHERNQRCFLKFAHNPDQRVLILSTHTIPRQQRHFPADGYVLLFGEYVGAGKEFERLALALMMETDQHSLFCACVIPLDLVVKLSCWMEVGGYDTINSVNSASKEANDA